MLSSDRRKPLVLPELVGTLALATDLAMNHPLEQGLGACLLAGAVGDQLLLREDERDRLFYLTLLRHIGCTAENSTLARVYGDERQLSARLGTMTGASAGQYLWAMGRFATEGRPPSQAFRGLGRIAVEMRTFPAYTAAICEVAATLARRLGLGPRVVAEVAMVYERWDGKGIPHGRVGEAIPMAVRIAQVADLAAALHDLGHPDPLAVVEARAGSAFDPAVVREFRRRGARLFAELDVTSRWDAVQQRRPAGPPMGAAEVDAGLAAVADFVDLKSTWLVGHSSGVARLAASAAQCLRMPVEAVDGVRRAALVRDLGRIGVTSAVWDKPGALTAGQWEAVRLHPYHTGRLLARSSFLARLGTYAADHHERLDGSGYHRQAGGAQLSPEARVLAAADVYHAMREARPHRRPLDADAAAKVMHEQVRAARLDADAAAAVLTAAGHRLPRRGQHPAGLTAREVEVLRLVARGLSTREVARELVIAPKTAGNHIASVYQKAGVTSRAAATLFAMQQGLVDPLR